MSFFMIVSVDQFDRPVYLNFNPDAAADFYFCTESGDIHPNHEAAEESMRSFIPWVRNEVTLAAEAHDCLGNAKTVFCAIGAEIQEFRRV